jgi:CRISPR-associated endonuclease Csn1
LDLEQLVIVLQQISIQREKSSGYLGAIGDRGKELYFNKQTVGQYLMAQIDKDPHASLKKQVFYRQDYLDEFDRIWETQAKFHKELTGDLKHEIRDVVIFYQRKLKSQKGLISFCEFERFQKKVMVDGKEKIVTTGLRAIPRSSPLFQEFKIWQVLNNIEIADKDTGEVALLAQDEKEKLFAELQATEGLTPDQALKTLFEKRYRGYSITNYKEKIEGNKTRAKICGALGGPVTDERLTELWHLLYSWEGENRQLAAKLTEKYGYSVDTAKKLSDVSLLEDHGSLSAKAIKKIMPYLKQGKKYSDACELAGYVFSKSSLTKDQIENKVLKDKLAPLPKNSLRNPVVEKILNQMIHVVNGVIDAYGKPDEIRIELARELKKNAKDREEAAATIDKNTKENERIRIFLQNEGLRKNPGRNDIIRYKLYEELASNGYKTLYSGTYIPLNALFSKDFDIEHIIPKARLFDDSFSNKTLEARDINLEKGNLTAYDFVSEKYGDRGDNGIVQYEQRIKYLFDNNKISRSKYNKLKMKEENIPDNFIDRDIRDTQYIAKAAKNMLEGLVKAVVSTTGSVTARLREDWQLIDVMKDLNWDKYHKLGLTEVLEKEDYDGNHIKDRRIKDWTKRNDHRHHAMDALTVAFTKLSFIQYLNNLNAKSDKSSSIYGIEQKELYRNDKNKQLFKPPFALDEFRNAAKKHLDEVLVSIKAKNKVVTQNVNKAKKGGTINKKTQATPRGQLHLETIYGSHRKSVVKEEPVNAKFDEAKIMTVTKPAYREALLAHLRENGNDPKKAFTGKNSLTKAPIYLDKLHTAQVPEKVKTASFETVYTVRKEITPDLKIDKVIDDKIKRILEARLREFGGDPKKAFANLGENPIWLNEKKGISIKNVTISGISNAEALHNKRDKDGNEILDSNGQKQPVDFVNTGNNHHVAVYRDASGSLQENVVSFFEAVKRANDGMPVIDKEYKQDEGWKFLFSMKQNEYFVFPNEETGFNPKEIDLIDVKNYALISQNLFRVQKLSTKNYVFNHHLETTAVTGDTLKNKKQLSKITFHIIQSLPPIENIVKVRIDHIGRIVGIGEL